MKQLRLWLTLSVIKCTKEDIFLPCQKKLIHNLDVFLFKENFKKNHVFKSKNILREDLVVYVYSQ